MARTDDIHVWRIFCEAARAGGVNAACDALQCEPSTVSRALKAIEAELGGALFERGTRPLRLTELGERANRLALGLLRCHDDMMTDLKGEKDRLAGVIRLAAHAGIGPIEITPALVEFQTIYPDIELELHQLTNSIPAVFSSESVMLDAAVGYGPDEPPEGIVARYVGEMPFIACASPLYLQRHGTPRHPADLIAHTGILLQTPSRNATETLSKDGQTVNLHWRNSLKFNSLISAKSAAMLGAGIIADMPLFHATHEFKTKQLVPILPGWRRKAAVCYVGATMAAWEKRRVRVFVDWLAERERHSLQKLRDENPAFYS